MGHQNLHILPPLPLLMHQALREEAEAMLDVRCGGSYLRITSSIGSWNIHCYQSSSGTQRHP